MSPSRHGSREVVALRFDEHAVAADLAAWCGGQVTWAPGPDGTAVATVWVPTTKGTRPALFGDWIVRRGDEDYRPYSPTEFAARFEPSSGGFDELDR
jgi:hypothetical protein